MTAAEARTEAYDEAAAAARRRLSEAIMDIYVQDLPEFIDLTEEEVSEAETAFARVAERQAPHDLHDYGFPVGWCGVCRDESGR